MGVSGSDGRAKVRAASVPLACTLCVVHARTIVCKAGPVLERVAVREPTTVHGTEQLVSWGFVTLGLRRTNLLLLYMYLSV